MKLCCIGKMICYDRLYEFANFQGNLPYELKNLLLNKLTESRHLHKQDTEINL